MRRIRPLHGPVLALLLALITVTGCDAILFDLDSVQLRDAGGDLGDASPDAGSRDTGPDTDATVTDDVGPDADADGEDVGPDTGLEVGPDDLDGDGIENAVDNCPETANPGQDNVDGDELGDACDDDLDGDGYANDLDTCRRNPDADQTDLDGDGQGNPCDLDDDGDGVADAADNCPLTPNTNQADFDSDGAGDVCSDVDTDGHLDADDNCREVPNADQLNTDATHPTLASRDALGDACDTDDDGDGLGDAVDNCDIDVNVCQWDDDTDNLGNSCDADRDGDGTDDASDNCPLIANGAQADADADGVGDVCEPTFGTACAGSGGTLPGTCDIVAQDCGDCRVCSIILDFTTTPPTPGTFCRPVTPSENLVLQEGEACDPASMSTMCDIGLFCRTGFCRRYCWMDDAQGCAPGQFCKSYGPPEIGYCASSC